MKNNLFLFILTVFLALASSAHAGGEGECHATHRGGSADEAYCSSFEDNEAACRMNNPQCRWYGAPQPGGSCNPRDAGSTADAAYCSSFDGNQPACEINSSTCRWSWR